MKVLHVIALGLTGWMLAASPAFADVKLTMGNGRVTLVAKDVTVRQILTEWARIGQTKIINLERIPGGPVSVELNDVPEAQALDVLLRRRARQPVQRRPHRHSRSRNSASRYLLMTMKTATGPRPTCPRSCRIAVRSSTRLNSRRS